MKELVERERVSNRRGNANQRDWLLTTCFIRRLQKFIMRFALVGTIMLTANRLLRENMQSNERDIQRDDFNALHIRFSYHARFIAAISSPKNKHIL